MPKTTKQPKNTNRIVLNPIITHSKVLSTIKLGDFLEICQDEEVKDMKALKERLAQIYQEVSWSNAQNALCALIRLICYRAGLFNDHTNGLLCVPKPKKKKLYELEMLFSVLNDDKHVDDEIFNYAQAFLKLNCALTVGDFYTAVREDVEGNKKYFTLFLQMHKINSQEQLDNLINSCRSDFLRHCLGHVRPVQKNEARRSIYRCIDMDEMRAYWHTLMQNNTQTLFQPAPQNSDIPAPILRRFNLELNTLTRAIDAINHEYSQYVDDYHYFKECDPAHLQDHITELKPYLENMLKGISSLSVVYETLKNNYTDSIIPSTVNENLTYLRGAVEKMIVSYSESLESLSTEATISGLQLSR